MPRVGFRFQPAAHLGFGLPRSAILEQRAVIARLHLCDELDRRHVLAAGRPQFLSGSGIHHQDFYVAGRVNARLGVLGTTSATAFGSTAPADRAALGLQRGDGPGDLLQGFFDTRSSVVCLLPSFRVPLCCPPVIY